MTHKKKIPINKKSAQALVHMEELAYKAEGASGTLRAMMGARRSAMREARSHANRMREHHQMRMNYHEWEYLGNRVERLRHMMQEVRVWFRRRNETKARYEEVKSECEYLEIDKPRYETRTVTTDESSMLTIFHVAEFTVNIQLDHGFTATVELHNKDMIDKAKSQFQMLTFATYKVPHGKRGGTLDDRVKDIIERIESLYRVQEDAEKKPILGTKFGTTGDQELEEFIDF